MIKYVQKNFYEDLEDSVNFLTLTDVAQKLLDKHFLRYKLDLPDTTPKKSGQISMKDIKIYLLDHESTEVDKIIGYRDHQAIKMLTSHWKQIFKDMKSNGLTPEIGKKLEDYCNSISKRNKFSID